MEVRAVQALESGRFEVRIEGASIEPGKLPLRDVERLAELIQNGLERTARVLRQEPGVAPGPLPREVVLATNLLLVGIEAGSAALELELPIPPEEELKEEGLFPPPPVDLGQKAMEAFVDGLHSLEIGSVSAVPERWDNSVMEVAEELANYTLERHYVIHLNAQPSRRPERTARVTPDIAGKFSVRHKPLRRRRVTRGRLILVDLKTARVDIENERGQRIQCLFPSEMEPSVRRLVGEEVLAAGEEEVDLALGKRGRLELSTLDRAPATMTLDEEFWTNRSAQEQAREQGVSPISSIAGLRAGSEFSEPELREFMGIIEESRRVEE